MPLVAFFGLMHLRISLARFVLGGAGGFDDSSINQRAFFKKDTGLRQPLVHFFKNLSGQALAFEQVPELQNGGVIGNGFIQ